MAFSPAADQLRRCGAVFAEKWFTRVLLREVRPRQEMDPYPLSARVEYLDVPRKEAAQLPEVLSLQPLNPLLFSPFVLRSREENLEDFKGTLACLSQGQPLQLFKGWPYAVSGKFELRLAFLGIAPCMHA